MDADTAEQVRTLMAKGFAGTVFLTTDDCRAAYEELSARGVEFTEPPEERPYGIDSGFRDPSGNNLRLTQVTMAGISGTASDRPATVSARELLPPRRVDALVAARAERGGAGSPA